MVTSWHAEPYAVHRPSFVFASRIANRPRKSCGQLAHAQAVSGAARHLLGSVRGLMLTRPCGWARVTTRPSIAFVGICEVARFLFCLLLFLPHMIQLRFIKHDLDRIIPAQIRVLFEHRADLHFSGSWGP